MEYSSKTIFSICQFDIHKEPMLHFWGVLSFCQVAYLFLIALKLIFQNNVELCRGSSGSSFIYTDLDELQFTLLLLRGCSVMLSVQAAFR